VDGIVINLKNNIRIKSVFVRIFIKIKPKWIWGSIRQFFVEVEYTSVMCHSVSIRKLSRLGVGEIGLVLRPLKLKKHRGRE